MTDTDNLYFFLLTTKQLAYGLCLGLDCTCRSFLYEDVTILSVFEGEEYEVYSFF